MSVKKPALQHKALNGWNLFWLVSGALCLVTAVEMVSVGVSTPPDVSHLIGFSVRLAVPFIYLVVAASALPVLFPGALSSWVLRNRKYIGLCFAVAMGWQGFFIFLMSNFNAGYYYEEIFYLRDELEGSTGYIFLTAMVLTSFQFGRRWINQQQWKLLHRFAMYYLWAYPFAVYWWALYYYDNAQTLDYIYYWTGFAAVALRIAAWGKRRLKASGGASIPMARKLAGGALAAAGLVVAATDWQKPVTDFLLGPDWSANFVLWMPYWPFEPYFSLFAIGLGTMLWTGASRATADERIAARPVG